jgi:hypothetical protein
VSWWPWATQTCGSTARARKNGSRLGYPWRAEADGSDNEADNWIKFGDQCSLRHSAQPALHEGARCSAGARTSAVGAAETNAVTGNNVAANFEAAQHCTTVQWQLRLTTTAEEK